MIEVSSDKLGKNIGLAVVAVIILLGLFWLVRTKLDYSQQPTPSSSPTTVNKIENFEANQKPNLFPAGLPVESGAKIISNYSATSPDGRVQATQAFESSKSVSANFKLYNDYLTKNNWTILAKDSSRADLQSIIAQNSSLAGQAGILNVTIHKASDSSKSIVDLSFLVAK